MNKINKAVEIGAGDIESSELLMYNNKFNEIHLFEPNFLLNKSLKEIKNENIVVWEAAVSNYEGQGKFFNLGYTSYLEGAESFIKTSCEDDAEKFWNNLSTIVDIVSIKNIDKGDIDFLVLTCQGSELDILSGLVSRPVIINTKYYIHNPIQSEYYNKITLWMQNNGYRGVLKDKNEMSTYFNIDFIYNHEKIWN